GARRGWCGVVGSSEPAPFRQPRPDQWTRDHRARLWGLMRWLDEPIATVPEGRQPLARHRPDMALAAQAYVDGVATDADLLDLLFEPGPSRWQGFRLLGHLTGRKPDRLPDP